MTRVLGRAALTVLLPLSLLAGCGDGDPPGNGGTPSASSPESSVTSPEPTDDPTTEPAGEVLDTRSATVTAPEGWTLDKRNTEINLVAEAPGTSTSFLGLYDYGPVPGLRLRDFTKLARDNFPAGPAAQLTEAELGGAQAYQLTTTGDGRRYVELGAINDGMAVDLSFDFASGDLSPAEQQEIIDSVLATFEWK